MFVHSLLSCKLLICNGMYDLEFMVMSVNAQPLISSFCICLFYRPPSSYVSIFDNLIRVLLSLHPFSFSHFLLIGDFNINFHNPSNHLFTHVSIFSLLQVVPSYTHVAPNGLQSLIDLA